MSDFDTVLERLLTDPAFTAALAADPDRALAGYALDDEERRLLRTQVVSGPGAQRTVEARTTQSSMMGLVGPVVSAFGAAIGSGQSFGSAQPLGSTPGAGTFGRAPGLESFGAAPGSDGAGPGETFGNASGREAFGAAPPSIESPGANQPGATSAGAAPPAGAPVSPSTAVGYETRIDADGDGRWDAHTAHERPDGGVDVRADLNRDGIVDFVGHDDNRDGLIDEAEYDTNVDGVMDRRLVDENGDGWLDRSEPIPPPPPSPASGATQTFGAAPTAS